MSINTLHKGDDDDDDTNDNNNNNNNNNNNVFSVHWYGASSFVGSIGFIPFFSTYGVSFSPLDVGYKAGRVFDSG